MSELENQKINEEIDAIIQSSVDSIRDNYAKVREAYKNLYDWPELDLLRHEICLCLMNGLNQSVITLTNHFLETLLKQALINKDIRENDRKIEEIEGKPITSFITRTTGYREKYNSKNLYKTIDYARKACLIDDQEEVNLHKYRELYRNGFGHSDKNKSFGDASAPVQAVAPGVENGGLVGEEGTFQLRDLIFAAGYIQAEMASQVALPNFLYLDKLARKIRIKVFEVVV